jgi:hypothetical protein
MKNAYVKCENWIIDESERMWQIDTITLHIKTQCIKGAQNWAVDKRAKLCCGGAKAVPEIYLNDDVALF